MKLFLSAVFAGALLIAAFVVSSRLGPASDVAGGGVDPAASSDVESARRSGPLSGPRSALQVELASAAPAGAAAGRASRTEGAPLGGDDRDPAPWRLGMRVRFVGVTAPVDAEAFEFMTVSLDGGGRRSVASAGERIDASGRRWLEAVCDIDAADLERATFSLGSSRGALAAADGRVLVGKTVHWMGSRRLAEAVAVDSARRSIDLGELELLPPRLVGRLLFDPPPSVETSVLVGQGIAPDAMASFFPGRTLGSTIDVPQGATALVVSSFAPQDSWFAHMRNRAGETTFSADAAAGADIRITVAQRSGLDVSVDLVRHPLAARVLVVRSNVALAALVSEAEFFERVRASRASAALPAPERLAGRVSYPVGLLELADGFYRAELWSLKQADGSRALLSSEAAQVAGDVVNVSM